MAVTNYKVFEEVHDLDAGIIEIVDKAVRFVNGETAHIEVLHERTLPEVEKHSLSFLKACCREIGLVGSNLYPRESNAKEVMVSPEKYFACI